MSKRTWPDNLTEDLPAFVPDWMIEPAKTACKRGGACGYDDPDMCTPCTYRSIIEHIKKTEAER